MDPDTPNVYHEEAANWTGQQQEFYVKKAPAPVAASDRIQTVDLVRGFALLGILLMNIPVFGIDNSIFANVIKGPHNTADFRTMQVIMSVFDGTMRGLFSMLFGAGMILFTMNKKEKPGGITVAEYYYRRLGILVIFGLVNAFIFLWEGDILFYYGLLGMVLYPFRNSKPKWLLVLGMVCIGFGLVRTLIQHGDIRDKRAAYVEAINAEKSGKKLSEKQQEAKTAWVQIEERQNPDTAATNKNVRTMRSGYFTIFREFIPRNAGNESWGTYFFAWDMLSMMLIGMALFRMGFFSNKLSTSTYVMGIVLGYGLGIPIGMVAFKGTIMAVSNIGSYVDHYRIPHWVLYDLRRMLIAVGHASLLLLVFRSGLVPWLMKALSNVGQMAFTNYLVQSIVCTVYFFGYGLGNYNKLSFHQLYYVVGVVWIAQLIYSSVWLRYYRFGPFEWVWRSLTYGKAQPMKR